MTPDGSPDVCGSVARIASLVNERPVSPRENQLLVRAEFLKIRAAVDEPGLLAHIDAVVRAVDWFVSTPEGRKALVAVEPDEVAAATAAIDRFARDRCGISTLPAPGLDGAAAGTTPPGSAVTRIGTEEQAPSTTLNEVAAGVGVVATGEDGIVSIVTETTVAPPPVPKDAPHDWEQDPMMSVLMESLGLSQQEVLEVLRVQNELADYAQTIRAHPGFVEFGMTGAGRYADTGMVVVEPNADGEALRQVLRPDIEVLVSSRDKLERSKDPAVIEAAAEVALPGVKFGASYQPFDDGYMLWVFADELPERAQERLTEELSKRGYGFLNVDVEASNTTLS